LKSLDISIPISHANFHENNTGNITICLFISVLLWLFASKTGYPEHLHASAIGNLQEKEKETKINKW